MCGVCVCTVHTDCFPHSSCYEASRGVVHFVVCVTAFHLPSIECPKFGCCSFNPFNSLPALSIQPFFPCWYEGHAIHDVVWWTWWVQALTLMFVQRIHRVVFLFVPMSMSSIAHVARHVHQNVFVCGNDSCQCFIRQKY